jgi:hypothetical protein
VNHAQAGLFCITKKRCDGGHHRAVPDLPVRHARLGGGRRWPALEAPRMVSGATRPRSRQPRRAPCCRERPTDPEAQAWRRSQTSAVSSAPTVRSSTTRGPAP